MIRILVVRNNYDPITYYMYEWSKPVIELAESRGIKVDCVDGSKVVKSEIESRMKKINPSFIFLNGHGDSRNFCGYEYEVVIGMDNASILKDKIVFARACNCADKLGNEAVKRHGCISFIGYQFEFINVRQTDVEIHPSRDTLSGPIWESSNAVPRGLIKGATVSESVESSHKKANTEISRLMFSSEFGAVQAIMAIIVNDEGLVYHGDGDARI